MPAKATAAPTHDHKPGRSFVATHNSGSIMMGVVAERMVAGPIGPFLNESSNSVMPITIAMTADSASIPQRRGVIGSRCGEPAAASSGRAKAHSSGVAIRTRVADTVHVDAPESKTGEISTAPTA